MFEGKSRGSLRSSDRCLGDSRHSDTQHGIFQCLWPIAESQQKHIQIYTSGTISGEVNLDDIY